MSYDIKCLLQKVFQASNQARSVTFPIEEPSCSTYGRVEKRAKKKNKTLGNIISIRKPCNKCECRLKIKHYLNIHMEGIHN